ncbi:AEC family transporter [Motiliproteus sediminis]|uniref:AEC family transporter n=1 Tax=Motiliproteus sediminis TaxID=1468178 RepID=UPI001AEF6DDD|nr:AEC family transporter [Motiliproteus sediminis]
MTILLNVVFPVFAIILAGYLCGRRRLLGEGAGEGLNKFVYWVALPALLFRAMAAVDIEQLLNWDFIGAYVGGQALTMVLGIAIGCWFFRNTLAEGALNGMNVIYGNTGFLGIPLALAAFGSAATVPTIITVVVNSALVVGVATVLVELSLNRASGAAELVKDVVLALAKNPMLVAPVAGILWALAGWPLPPALDKFCELLGAAAGPCALFAIGLFLVGKPVSSGLGEVSVALVIKLLVQPAVTWWLAVSVFDMSPLWAAVAVVMAATPTGAGSFVMAQQYGVYVQRTSSVILLSTVFSVLTLFALLYGYDHLLI